MEINILLTLNEIESDRSEAMAEMPDKHGEPDIAAVEERYANSVGYREALHTAFIFHENVEHYLAQHPCVVFDDEAYRLARLAGELLFELYQRLGSLDYESSTHTVSGATGEARNTDSYPKTATAGDGEHNA